jgi:hypothetical protein
LGRLTSPGTQGCYDASLCPAPASVPPPEKLGFVALEMADGGGGAPLLQGETLQAYPLHAAAHAVSGDCAVHAGPQTCHGRGRPIPLPDVRPDSAHSLFDWL